MNENKDMISFTESDSHFTGLDKMTTRQLLEGINEEDKTVPYAVEKVIPKIEAFVEACYERMKNGGRLFYLGAGTSGRLGVVDASELPPTYGVDFGWVIGLIAGGDSAIRKAVEGAEDDPDMSWKELQDLGITPNDAVLGIAASGTTPYVVGGVRNARKFGCLTGGITCNENPPLAQEAEYPIEVITGPEFVTGSTRMKAGTAQKLVLNMISTALMIRLGRVKGNKMINMQLTNKKLVNRGTRMLMEELHIEAEEAQKLLLKYGSVKKALENV
ncbi:MAG: N-acetylmuramic acid 6-phosphate etherase [Dysgonamonadaceae bacterium]|jgi:N-acetylmuramic acid 6-phosphate etherase|nr:N-acetylmuramic acid 6-phosphate etherase [Dysgonamonadaceae bacterium]